MGGASLPRDEGPTMPVLTHTPDRLPCGRGFRAPRPLAPTPHTTATGHTAYRPVIAYRICPLPQPERSK